MSAAALILQFIFAFLGWLLSIKGVFVLLCGIVLFLALPIIPRATGEFKKFATLHLWFSTFLLDRAAVVVSEHGDTLLKQMQFDDLGVEAIKLGSEVKVFEDPDEALHYWMGIPFALADEVHGVLFDPRHAALGARKSDHDNRGEYSVPATPWEWDKFNIGEWRRAVFEFPQGVHELVDLGKIRKLVDGGERSEYARRVEELYKHSRDPFQSDTSATRFILILVALLGPFAMMWVLAGQSGGGGGGGSTVGRGTEALLLVPTPAVGAWLAARWQSLREYASDAWTRARPIIMEAAERIRAVGASGGDKAAEELQEVDWRHVGIILAVLLPLPVMFLLVFAFVSPLTAIFAFIVLGMGFWLIPLLAVLSKPSTRLSGGLASLLMKLGLTGYEKPVFEWTPAKYRLREYSALGDTQNVTWYGIAGQLVGFTFDPTQDSWGPEIVKQDELRSRMEAVPDGGQPTNSNLPLGCTRVPDMTRASVYAGFAPTSLDDDAYYLNTGIATGRFSDSATGEKSLDRLLKAKEEHGGDNSLSDKAMIYAMVGCGVLSTGLGVFVFFL